MSRVAGFIIQSVIAMRERNPVKQWLEVEQGRSVSIKRHVSVRVGAISRATLPTRAAAERVEVHLKLRRSIGSSAIRNGRTWD